jgi:hypothetical protein
VGTLDGDVVGSAALSFDGPSTRAAPAPHASVDVRCRNSERVMVSNRK